MEQITIEQWREAKRHGHAHVMQNGQRAIIRAGERGTELVPVKVITQHGPTVDDIDWDTVQELMDE